MVIINCAIMCFKTEESIFDIFINESSLIQLLEIKVLKCIWSNNPVKYISNVIISINFSLFKILIGKIL